MRHHWSLVWHWTKVSSAPCKGHHGDCDVCMLDTKLRNCNHMLTISKWWWLGQTSYVWTCALAKISIALALLRLTVAKIHRLILYSVIGVTCVIGLVFWFMLTLQCQPVSFFWQRVRLELDPKAGISGTCMNLDSIIAIAYVYSVTATCCDLTLGLLPVFLVWNLQMNTRTKAALAAILGMGCVYDSCSFPDIAHDSDIHGYSASAAVIIRIPFLHDYKDKDFLCEFRASDLLHPFRL